MHLRPLRRRDYRLLYAAQFVSFLGTMLTYVALPFHVYRLTHSSLAVGLLGLAIVAFGFCGTLWPSLFFLALAGGADAVSAIFRSTLWNQTIPDALRGRMAGIEMVSYMSGPLLGHVEAGAAAALFGVRVSVISGGVLCVVGVLACGALLPRFVGYDARARMGTDPINP